MYQTALLLSFLVFSLVGNACPGLVNVRHADGKPMPDVTVVIAGNRMGDTDNAGRVSFDLPAGEYRLQLFIGAVSHLDSVLQVDWQTNNHMEVVLNRSLSPVELEEVAVYSMTEEKQLERTPYAVQAIDLAQSYHRGGDVSEILTKASGIKLRSDGNIGAPVQINLGGLQGKAVRIFRDGIPIELFGHGFSLGTIPVNMLERVEIYNGVMPIHLAADALGGGVNLVSRKEQEPFAELSYEIGSFNTHRATVNGRWQDPQQKWYAGTSSSYNSCPTTRPKISLV